MWEKLNTSYTPDTFDVVGVFVVILLMLIATGWRIHQDNLRRKRAAMPETTLEAYLRDANSKGIIDHSIRAMVHANGEIVFYIHPTGKDGDTKDFAVKDNTLESR